MDPNENNNNENNNINNFEDDNLNNESNLSDNNEEENNNEIRDNYDENYINDNNINNDENDDNNANINENNNENTNNNLDDTEEENPNHEGLNRSYDEDEDFPQYANRINKKLNAIIKNYKAEINTCQNDIEDNLGMVSILDEHSKSVETQVKNKQMILDHTREQIKLEEHMKQTTNRQIGKLNTQIITLEDHEIELQERLNSIQHNIYKANEKMDKYKIEMKFKQDELEQYAMTARQKEDDNLNIEKYKRQDELRIKELMLMIERYTIEVNRKHQELEKEVTETQASQIEMEKTAEELKQLQLDRQGLLDKLLTTEKQITKRHEELKGECETYLNHKTDILSLKKELDEKVEELNQNSRKNKHLQENVKKEESDLQKRREVQSRLDKDIKEMTNDIEIKKNELSAIAKELNKKNHLINHLNNDLEIKKKKLDEAKTFYNSKKNDLTYNLDNFKDAKKQEEEIMNLNDDLEKRVKNKRLELEKTVNDLYEKSKKLFKAREAEANMIGEINNIISAKKNINANIFKLNQEITKQQELIYNVDFQIQLMERKVAWVQGKRTQEETKEINNEIESLQETKSNHTQKLTLVSDSVKSIEEELRSVESQLKTAQEEEKKLTIVIEELELENIKCGQNLVKVTKSKEEILVQHDLMKLEIKKLYDKLVSEANQVFKEENKLFQLELSIKEREKEIQVHKDILVAEHKKSEEARHKVATELSQKLIIANNLKLKYESIQKKSKTIDGIEHDEHSQAWQVIKTAQEKEELQRQKDENDGMIAQCKEQLQSLFKTINNLKENNERLKKHRLEKKLGKVDVTHKEELENKVAEESQEMWDKKTELKKLNEVFQKEAEQINEKMKAKEILAKKLENLENEMSGLALALNKTKEKYNRAVEADTRMLRAAKQKKPDFSIASESNIDYEIKLMEEQIRNQYLMNAISILCNENVELRNAINNPLQEKGINIPNRPISEKSDTMSQISGRSRMSGI